MRPVGLAANAVDLLARHAAHSIQQYQRSQKVFLGHPYFFTDQIKQETSLNFVRFQALKYRTWILGLVER